MLGTAPAGAAVHPSWRSAATWGLDDLGARGVLQVLVEGAAVARAFHAAGLVDRYVVYLAPCLFGGDGAPGCVRRTGVASIADV
ncbi:MAG: dihydrofolate reductase family protein [Acidimicrobiales bacterium]